MRERAAAGQMTRLDVNMCLVRALVGPGSLVLGWQLRGVACFLSGCVFGMLAWRRDQG